MGFIEKAKRMKEEPIIKSTKIKKINFFLIRARNHGTKIEKIIFIMFIAAVMNPNHNRLMFTARR